MRVFKSSEPDLYKAMNHPSIPRIGEVFGDEIAVEKTAEPSTEPDCQTVVKVRYERRCDYISRMSV